MASSSVTEAKTDAEVVELCRREMQGIIDRTDFSKTGRELQASPGMPVIRVRLIAADLTEIGRFSVELPPEATVGYPKVIVGALRRHWVYRHKDGRIVTLQASQRIKFRMVGYVDAPAFLNDVGLRS